MRFESAEMHRKACESEEARWRKPADDLKRQDQSSAPAKKPHTWLSRVIQPALAVLLLLSLAAEGQAGVSGPALVGALSITQVDTSNALFEFAGICKGKTAPFSITLPFVVSGKTAADVEGFPLSGQGPAQCLSQTGGEDLTVVTVVTPLFFNSGDKITAHVVILYAVP